MKIRRMGIALLAVVLLAVGMAGCDDIWSINLDDPVKITDYTTFVVKAEGEDPLDARTQVEKIMSVRGYRMITAEASDNDTLYLIISYEYFPEKDVCRYFTFVLRDAGGQDIKTGTHMGDKSLKDLLMDFESFLRSPLFKK